MTETRTLEIGPKESALVVREDLEFDIVDGKKAEQTSHAVLCMSVGFMNDSLRDALVENLYRVSEKFENLERIEHLGVEHFNDERLNEEWVDVKVSNKDAVLVLRPGHIFSFLCGENAPATVKAMGQLLSFVSESKECQEFVKQKYEEFERADNAESVH